MIRAPLLAEINTEFVDHAGVDSAGPGAWIALAMLLEDDMMPALPTTMS
jgi:hypothetical protein